MSFLPVEVVPYLKYCAPPLVGAFIGYLTNRVAIRMLFRPLKEWRILGIRVPMTPGVIPSKRHELAENMGEVVGDHLLTSKEIGRGLQEEKFQSHLLSMISERTGAVLAKDLPPIEELVPVRYRSYLHLGARAVKYQIKDTVHKHIHSDEFERKVKNAVEKKVDVFLNLKVGSVLGGSEREAIYQFIESSVSRMFASPEMKEWLDEFVQQHVYAVIQKEKSLADVVPDSLLGFMKTTVREQTPSILQRLGLMLSDSDVRDGIIAGVWGGIESFVVSLGPMGGMVQNFLDRETVDTKIREYLDEKKDEIDKWLGSPEFQEKVTAILLDRFETSCAKPLVEILDAGDDAKVENFCEQISGQLFSALQSREVNIGLTSMIKTTVETHLEDGDATIMDLLCSFLGTASVESAKGWVTSESIKMLRAGDTLETLDCMIDSMIDNVLKKRVGKLTRFLPHDVCEEIYRSIQKMASTMLEKEVPGLVESLDIRNIVAEKLNSLDLLRLEGLLLSIMEEQFKYINLFGALLGFLIGCCNLFLLYIS